MTETITAGVANEGETHPYDYYYRPGMELRPAPPRAEISPEWLEMRRRLFSPWIKVREVPEETPLTRRVADHLWQGDELMDDVVRLSRRIGAENLRTMLDTALEHGIEAIEEPPAELKALFQQLYSRPGWFDAELFERGRVLMINSSAFAKLGGQIVNVIMWAYGDPVSAASGATGQLERYVYRRQLETSDFFRKIALPDTLDRFSEAFKTNARVRLMHSQVRQGLKRKWGAEVYAQHGDPISNTDMALGVPAYGVINLIIDASLGRRVTMADLEAVNMYWRYNAYRFGVSEEVIPQNAVEAIEMFDYVLSRLGKGTQWSEGIAKTLTDFAHTMMTSSDSKLANLVGEKVAFPLYCAIVAHLGGDPVGYRTVEAGGFSQKQLKAFGTAYQILGGAAVRLSALADRRPGRWRRMRLRAADGDGFINGQHKMIEALGAKNGVLSATFDAYDTRKSGDFHKK
ncbi:oxygenase MpaB family protein [Streptomyces ipomoeae]|uniref:oxygenase MpaB family protein n=1 Tax=Streptomyces ipomoeae TaxID=103232 RepID=UPI001146D065|nr:oxygenase MpaB family protein [Streptomyces ipomoeae]MDX2937735.1 oxygenase MpaB family protein [Streptomyces ipomoeae]TQE17257.1 DUF2236 domain-containing protein [Streptomyces ipomoeae]